MKLKTTLMNFAGGSLLCRVRAAMMTAMLCASATVLAQSQSPSTKWHWDGGTIVVDTPARPAGQQHVVGLTAPRLATVRVGFVGLGMRGPGAVSRFTHIPGVQIVALCDYEEGRAERCQKYLRDAGLPPAEIYSGATGYEALCQRADIDLVYVATDWDHHFPVAKCALENGKHVAVEVPSAMNLEQCWELINLSERTRKHCMILENCCYDFFELTALTMAQQGVFGDIIHVEGSYHHNLDPYWDNYWHNWRLDFNQKYRGDLYPTHGFGPVCQALNIHRGDRLTTLVAMDTDAFNGPKLVEKRTGKPCTDFQNGDETMTMIRTAKGKSILIEHDVMTPRPYDRMYQLVGTDGYAAKYPVGQVCLRTEATGEVDYEDLEFEKVYEGDELEELMAKYRNPILTPELEALAKEVGGHGGMDFIMDYRLVYCLNNGLPLDMDVYDLAEWCCVTELSRISIENGCVPVEIPDFTRGDWDKIQGFSYAFAH